MMLPRDTNYLLNEHALNDLTLRHAPAAWMLQFCFQLVQIRFYSLKASTIITVVPTGMKRSS